MSSCSIIMNITNECVRCIVGQIDKATKLLELDEKLSEEIMEEVSKEAPSIKKAGGGIARMLGE